MGIDPRGGGADVAQVLRLMVCWYSVYTNLGYGSENSSPNPFFSICTFDQAFQGAPEVVFSLMIALTRAT